MQQALAEKAQSDLNHERQRFQAASRDQHQQLQQQQQAAEDALGAEKATATLARQAADAARRHAEAEAVRRE